MKLNSRFAGTPLKEYHTKIPWRATTNYAAAVADDNPLYFDDKKVRIFDAKASLAAIESHRITVMGQIPTMFRMLWNLPEEILIRLRQQGEWDAGQTE
ncbi:MAG: hypothetical protein K8S13_05735 [Desulfobacula sp.]|uniref:hypothetical protein n=1 Tax=Desulfobacula sp. TaxID=2593537 RepID=UPI0025C43F43|nr:hypothetical protein [Desulfobacula sp.]MCD4719345.1 hypothetical protein [Desulfobacula sp.]